MLLSHLLFHGSTSQKELRSAALKDLIADSLHLRISYLLGGGPIRGSLAMIPCLGLAQAID